MEVTNTQSCEQVNPPCAGINLPTIRSERRGEKSFGESSRIISKDQGVESSPPPYSAFTTNQKKWIVAIAALAGWFSTASSFIYFPAIPFISRDLGVSIEQVNLTVTSYLIASGIFPSIFGNAADRYGRRPIFMASISLYVATNVGLALQRSFAGLVTLRMLQSVAISGLSNNFQILARVLVFTSGAGTFSFAYGVLGDLTTPANRGSYIGFISLLYGLSCIPPLVLFPSTRLTKGSLNTPPSVAPLLSGLLLIKWTWPAIFWFLCATSSIVLVAIVLFLPETCQRLVGDGSIRGNLIANTAPIPLLTPHPQNDRESSPSSNRMRDLKQVLNPFAAFSLLKNQGTLICVLCYGVYYTLYSCTQASLSTIFVEIYGVSGLIAGLSYIPFGIGSIAASSLAGRLLDYDFKRTAKSVGHSVDSCREYDLDAFPIELARLRTTKWVLATCAPLIAGYGWSLSHKVHIAIPLVLQFWIGFTNQVNFTSLNALLLDYHPSRPSAMQAANNFFRCELAAGGLAILDLMLRSLGPGWCFVVFAFVHILTLPALWLVEHRGFSWRQRSK